MKLLTATIYFGICAFSALISARPDNCESWNKYFLEQANKLPEKAHHTNLKALIKPDSSIVKKDMGTILSIDRNDIMLKPFFDLQYNNSNCCNRKEQITYKAEKVKSFLFEIVPELRFDEGFNESSANWFLQDDMKAVTEKIMYYDETKKKLSNLHEFYDAISGCLHADRKRRIFLEYLAEAILKKQHALEQPESRERLIFWGEPLIWKALMKAQNSVSSRSYLGAFVTVCLGTCAGLMFFKDFEGIKEIIFTASKGLN